MTLNCDIVNCTATDVDSKMQTINMINGETVNIVTTSGLSILETAPDFSRSKIRIV